ncbi:glycoside hydrolase family 2 protein [Edaphobacter bradus]|uniref:glycoside hydrolase family 2 protein n=1 Tax=Edaphobacter bradus TaxID=2259016 RepID=UPI0021E0E80F|nr:glycoside hydrolase family 2 TIM barrel-domain containing protein [Edaphobacter bradus]
MNAAKVSQSASPEMKFSLDQDWLFGGKVSSQLEESQFAKVTLPHCVARLSWESWNPDSWEDVWLYRRYISLPQELPGRRVFLKFDAIMTAAEVSINGVSLPAHQGGYLPVTYEITQALKKGDNVLDVRVDARFENVPPAGSPRGPRAVDYYLPGGMIRGAMLFAVPDVFISDVFAKPMDVLEPRRRVEIACSLDAATSPEEKLQLEVNLLDGTHVVSSTRKELSASNSGKFDEKITLGGLSNIKLWDVDSPKLYDLVVTLTAAGRPVHDYRTRIGFREAKFTVDGFFLNGRRLHLFGLNRHELYPYVGYAMPPRVMRRDAEIIRNEFHCNIVRCSHYPQSESFLEACDELGLMVWEETPGWQYIGDAAFQDLVVQNVGDMIVRDRNHASIVIWGVRVNESRNEQPLYKRTTALAKSLDDSRPCSGSMTGFDKWQEDWHEDVFAMDDYHQSPDGTVQIYPPLPGIPYMLAETVGQRTYTATGFNNVYRRAGDIATQYNQALYHAQAHDKALAYPRLCGVIAWCAFEYGSPQNSHKGVKNPGVADVFRVPKLGAAFYQSQVSPDIKPVILPNFYWNFGPSTPRGPGKGAAIFSNCDQLKLYVDGKLHSTIEPDRKNYPNLKHSPFFADLDLDGANHPELRIDGYVASRKVTFASFSSDLKQDQFFVTVDDEAIVGDGLDATRVVFRVADKFGAPRLFAGGDVNFTLTGPGLLVGDNPFFLTESGGVGAIWLRGLPNTSGKLTLQARHCALGSKSIVIAVHPDTGARRV